MGGSFCAGVDVGGTRLRLAVQDIASGDRPAPLEIAVPRSVESMVDAIEILTREATRGKGVDTIAVGLPGQVLDSGCVWVPNLRFLDGVPLANLVTQRLGAGCRLLNDAQATLLAEVAEGAAQGCSDVVLVAVGTGIGGAYQVDGRLVQGANGCAGSFGWLPFSGSARDADHGQWEQTGSGLSLERRATPWGSTGALLKAARAGDAAARTVVTEYGAALGEGIAALASILDPEVVVFAGGLVSAFDLLRDSMTEGVAVHGSPAGSRKPLVPAALGGAAGVIGALHWACTPEEAQRR